MSSTPNTTLASARKLSPVLFFVVLLCFLLPFVTISCDAAGAGGGRADVTTLTGLEVITGKDVTISTTGTSQRGHIDWEPWALIAALAAVAGLAVAFVPGRIGSLGGAIAGGLAFIFFLLTKFSIDGRINKPVPLTSGSGSTSTSIPSGITLVALYQVGYWLALVLSAAAAGVFIYFVVTEPADQPTASTSQPWPPPASSDRSL